ncbi:MAG: cohesin domain-containing protein, partial [Candidatus Bathyarchaeales archaeon]
RTCATRGAVEYSGTEAGLLDITFTIIKEPDPGKTLRCMLWLEPEGTYTLDENIEENDEERIDGYYEIVSAIPPPPPPPSAKIYLDPERIVNAALTPCNSFNVSVKIENATNVHSFQFKLTADKTILNITDAYFGDFLPGATGYYTIDYNEGSITFTAQLPIGQPPVNGSGTLAIIEFHVILLGETGLNFSETWIRDQEAQELPFETYDGYFNNMMIPKLAVDPPEITDPTLVPPKTFQINITLAEVEGVYDYEFKLGFDPTVLACLKVDIQDVFGETNYIPQFSVNNALGFVWVRVDYYEPAIPISTMEPVTLVKLTFRVKAMGISILDLHETELSNTEGGLIQHEVYDGLFQTIIRDAAVTDVKPEYEIVYEGWRVNINVTVRNEGNLTENIEVKVYYGVDALIGTLNFDGIPPDAEATLSIAWNTKGVTPCTNYTIWAQAQPLPYETDLADNTLYDGGVKIKMMGDVNGDGKVDGKDTALLAAAFGTTPENPRWNPDADLNNDKKIDGKDVALIAKNYGKTCT